MAGFVIKKIISDLIMPPGIFIVLLMCYGFWLILKKRRDFWFPLILSTILYLLSIEPVKDFLLLPLENSYPPVEENVIDNNTLIVVLGGGIYDSSPEEKKTGSLTPDATKRLLYGFRLFSRYGGYLSLSGGRVLKNKDIPSEAEVMANILKELNVPLEKIFLDEKSLDTFENARNVAALVKEKDFKNIVLVTSAYHIPRSVMLFEKMGVKVTPAPTDYKTDRTGYRFESFFPKMNYLKDCWCAIHEYLGIAFYKLKM